MKRGDLLFTFATGDKTRKLYTGGGVNCSVMEFAVCDCGADATVIIQGETDSMGFEPMGFCDACHKKCEAEENTHADALDVEDTPAPEGQMYFFYAGTNYDGKGEWYGCWSSLRPATVEFRRAENLAERWGGIYPCEGIILMPADEAQARVSRIRRAIRGERDYIMRDYDDVIDQADDAIILTRSLLQRAH